MLEDPPDLTLLTHRPAIATMASTRTLSTAALCIEDAEEFFATTSAMTGDGPRFAEC